MEVKIRFVADSDNNMTGGPPFPAGFDSADCTIDARGLLCPEPLVLCRQAMNKLGPGALVHVIASDPHAEIDFEVFTRRSDHDLVRSTWSHGAFHVLVCKA